MGRDLFEHSPAARKVFEAADDVVGYALSSVCFEGPEDKLRDTEYAQPAIFVTSLACLAAAIDAGSVIERPAFMAGHSLGEYSALVAAGALSLEQGLTLVQERGRLMAKASMTNPGTLAAILGMEEAAVEAICREADADICNFNLPSQTVVGGTREAVARAIALAKERGAQRALELNVSGAFHSRLMRPAVDGLTAAVRRTTVSHPEVGVVGNISAQLLKDADDVRADLAAQVARPVRWHESVTLMASGGASSFTEFGPGRVLTGMVRRLIPGVTIRNVSNLEDAAPRRPA